MVYLLICAALLLILIVIITIRTIRFRTGIPHIDTTITDYPDIDRCVKNLSTAVTFKTVSHADYSSIDWNEFTKLHTWLEKTYPLIYRNLERKTIHDYTLVYHWPGTDPSAKPLLFIAHQDVVPAGDSTKWSHDPFGGDICDDGYIWGRGVFDIKVQMISVLEVVEHLLAKGYVPQRGLYICFGHDEEVGGGQGAAAAAAYFKEQGIQFSFLIDEGGAVTENMIGGLTIPLAAVGIGEKGYLDAELTCIQKGGHSSTPPARTALGRVARAAARLESRQFPTELTKVPALMFKAIGPFMPLIYRIVLANLWLFKPLFLLIMKGGGAQNAMVRTTTAVTMASGSEAPNVLATTAKATVNLRLMTGTSSDMAVERLHKVINDEHITITKLLVNEPSNISPTGGKAYTILDKTIHQIFPDAVVSPYLMLGGTDSIKYQDVCENIFRFCPVHVSSSELDRMHSFDERLSIDNVEKSIMFFMQLFENLQNNL